MNTQTDIQTRMIESLGSQIARAKKDAKSIYCDPAECNNRANMFLNMQNAVKANDFSTTKTDFESWISTMELGTSGNESLKRYKLYREVVGI